MLTISLVDLSWGKCYDKRQTEGLESSAPHLEYQGRLHGQGSRQGVQAGPTVFEGARKIKVCVHC